MCNAWLVVLEGSSRQSVVVRLRQSVVIVVRIARGNSDETTGCERVVLDEALEAVEQRLSLRTLP